MRNMAPRACELLLALAVFGCVGVQPVLTSEPELTAGTGKSAPMGMSVVFERAGSDESASPAVLALRGELEAAALADAARLDKARAAIPEISQTLSGPRRGGEQPASFTGHAATSAARREGELSMAAATDRADFQVNLHPPAESVADAQEALDALTVEEDAKRVAAADEFALAKKELLNKVKSSIYDLVARRRVPSGLTAPALASAEAASFAQTGAGERADYRVNLQPPVESVKDTEEAISALTVEEENKRVAAEEEMSLSKRELLSKERTRIRGLVARAVAQPVGALATRAQGLRWQ